MTTPHATTPHETASPTITPHATTPHAPAPAPEARARTGAASAGAPADDHAQPARRRVLLVGIDGLRLDVLEKTPTPHLDRVLVDGCLTSSFIPSGTPTVSGPMWSSVLTGVWAAEHGVMDNETPPVERRPDVLSRLLDADPRARVFAAASWMPLTSVNGCGPVIDPTRVDCFAAEHAAGGDIRTADHAVARLRDHADPLRAAFVHLVEIDGAGHAHGVGEEYVEALLRVDAQLGRILDALHQRPDAEDWTVLVTTDHGHRDDGGHGGTSEYERIVWIGASDARLAHRLRDSSDIAPLLLELTVPVAAKVGQPA